LTINVQSSDGKKKTTRILLNEVLENILGVFLLVLEYKLKQRKTLINKVYSGRYYNQLELK
jgi:hypothetical protein